MGTYIDLALRLTPDRFRKLVQVEVLQDPEDPGFWHVGGMTAELGEDYVRASAR